MHPAPRFQRIRRRCVATALAPCLQAAAVRSRCAPDEYPLLCQRGHRVLQAPDIAAAACKALPRKKSNAKRSAIE
jgi:hypothetical protein